MRPDESKHCPPNFWYGCAGCETLSRLLEKRPQGGVKRGISIASIFKHSYNTVLIPWHSHTRDIPWSHPTQTLHQPPSLMEGQSNTQTFAETKHLLSVTIDCFHLTRQSGPFSLIHVLSMDLTRWTFWEYFACLSPSATRSRTFRTVHSDITLHVTFRISVAQVLSLPSKAFCQKTYIRSSCSSWVFFFKVQKHLRPLKIHLSFINMMPTKEINL